MDLSQGINNAYVGDCCELFTQFFSPLNWVDYLSANSILYIIMVFLVALLLPQSSLSRYQKEGLGTQEGDGPRPSPTTFLFYSADTESPDYVSQEMV